MKKNYTFVSLFAILLFSFSAFGQSRISGIKPTPIAIETAINTGSDPAPLSTYTLFPGSFGSACAATKHYYIMDAKTPIDTGYIFGNNIYDETECAQRYKFVTGTISQVLVAVAHKAGTTGTTTAKIYSVDPTTKAPQTVLGTSAAITTGSITNNSIIAYTFSTPVAVSNGFYASVTLPTTVGDTVVLVVNQFGCSTTDSLAWENYAVGGWWSATHNYGDNTDLYILPVGDVNAGISEYSAMGLSLLGAYPNPANDFTSISYRIDEPASVSVDIFDLTGRIILHSSEKLAAGTHDLNVPLKGVASGTYYYNIKAGNTHLTSKFIVTK